MRRLPAGKDMSEPFVFHFRSGPHGPEQMYLADIRAECGVCGHAQVQRYYHSTPVHSVTVRSLHELALGVAQKTGFECPNCGSEVQPEHALSTAFTWAFPDDAGLIRAFLPDASDPQSLRWQLAAGRRLDPQELPGWQVDPASEHHVVLDDELLEDRLGRPLNPKTAIREVLADWGEDPAGGAIARLGPMTLIAAETREELDELEGEIEEPGAIIALDDCVPMGLPTHEDPAEIAGRFSAWLPANVKPTQVRVHVADAPAAAAIQRAFAVGNLTADYDDGVFSNITTPRDSLYPRPLPLDAVLRRAVYTGLTPGDAARLTAEEIVGTLLRVW